MEDYFDGTTIISSSIILSTTIIFVHNLIIYYNLVTKYVNKAIPATVEKNSCIIEKFRGGRGGGGRGGGRRGGGGGVRGSGGHSGSSSHICILSLIYTIDGLEYKNTINVNVNENKKGDILNIRYNNNDKNDIILDSEIKKIESILYYSGIILAIMLLIIVAFVILGIYYKKISNTSSKPKKIKTSNTISKSKIIKTSNTTSNKK
jgi:hypothetical protein